MKFPQEQSEGLGGARIDIASLYSYSQALTEPVSLPGRRRMPNALKITPVHHTLPSFRLILAQTAIGWGTLQVYPSKSISTRVITNQTPTPTKREDSNIINSSWRDPSPLSNPGGSKTDGWPAFWSALLITSFNAECLGKRPELHLPDKPCKLLLSIFQAQRQEWGIQT